MEQTPLLAVQNNTLIGLAALLFIIVCIVWLIFRVRP